MNQYQHKTLCLYGLFSYQLTINMPAIKLSSSIVILGLIGIILPTAFAEEEEIKFISIWLKQPILEVDASSFSEDDKAVDFSINNNS